MKTQQHGFYKEKSVGTSLVVQWLRLCAPNAGSSGSVAAQGPRSHRPCSQNRGKKNPEIAKVKKERKKRGRKKKKNLPDQ